MYENIKKLNENMFDGVGLSQEQTDALVDAGKNNIKALREFELSRVNKDLLVLAVLKNFSKAP